MNINSPAASSILNPYPTLARTDNDGNWIILVRTDSASSAVTVADMISLAQQGAITLHNVDSSGNLGLYGTAAVTYSVN